MHARDTASQYTAIASSWSERTFRSKYGVPYLDRATKLVTATTRDALDVGCGGGRLAVHLDSAGFNVTALDASEGMLEIAKANAPSARIECADIAVWETGLLYDLIVAWDSTFHLPKHLQVPVLRKLCRLLRPKGVLLFTAGGVDSERTSERDGFVFHYSSVAMHVLAETLDQEACQVVLLERDQHPEDHIVVIAVRGDV